MTEIELKRATKRYGVKRVRTWWLDGPGLPERLISKSEWRQMHGSAQGWKPYVAEFEAELLISEMPRVPEWLISVPALRCARDARHG